MRAGSVAKLASTSSQLVTTVIFECTILHTNECVTHKCMEENLTAWTPHNMYKVRP